MNSSTPSERSQRCPTRFGSGNIEPCWRGNAGQKATVYTSFLAHKGPNSSRPLYWHAHAQTQQTAKELSLFKSGETVADCCIEKINERYLEQHTSENSVQKIGTANGTPCHQILVPKRLHCLFVILFGMDQRAWNEVRNDDKEKAVALISFVFRTELQTRTKQRVTQEKYSKEVYDLNVQ